MNLFRVKILRFRTWGLSLRSVLVVALEFDDISPVLVVIVVGLGRYLLRITY